jgi:hypothetical protein
MSIISKLILFKNKTLKIKMNQLQLKVIFNVQLVFLLCLISTDVLLSFLTVIFDWSHLVPIIFTSLMFLMVCISSITYFILLFYVYYKDQRIQDKIIFEV